MKYSAKMNSLKKGEGVPLLTVRGGTGLGILVPLLHRALL